jgi:hypothetical protein
VDDEKTAGAGIEGLRARDYVPGKAFCTIFFIELFPVI